jgi:hypothetical protein
MTIGSFESLSWRMDPSVSYSDWTIEITRTTTVTSKTASIDRYYVHRNVLAVGPRHSEYFAAQFQLQMQENLNGISRIVLEDSRADVFPLLLDFIYCGQIPEQWTAAAAAALHHLSEYFDMPRLREMVEKFYHQHLTMATLVDFISQAKEHHAETLLQIAVKKSVQHLLEIDPLTARLLGPELLLQILNKNQELGNRRYGFHVSKLVAACCCRSSSQEEELQGNNEQQQQQQQQQHTKELFDQLTDMQILPYIESKAAVYLLSIDAEYHYSPPQPELTCLQQRCTQAITEKWSSIRARLPTDEALSQALAKVPSHILIDILMKATSEMALTGK